MDFEFMVLIGYIVLVSLFYWLLSRCLRKFVDPEGDSGIMGLALPSAARWTLLVIAAVIPPALYTVVRLVWRF